MGSGINSWCAEHMQSMQKVQRDAMNDEDRRTNTIKELTDIKAILQDAKDGVPNATGKAAVAIDKFVADHKDDPDLAGIMKSLQSTKDRLDGAQTEFVAGSALNSGGLTKMKQGDYSGGSSDVSSGAGMMADASTKAKTGLDGDLVSIQGVIDELTKGNQMGMLDIQESNSQMNQVFQTASNIASSRATAAQTAVGNIRG
jgi:hypothetical protein